MNLEGEKPHHSEMHPAGVFETVLSLLMKIGLWGSVVLILAGSVIVYFNHPLEVLSHDELASFIGNDAQFPNSPAEVRQSIQGGHGRGVITVGLMVLMATPILIVLASCGHFLYRREWWMAAVTFFVLLVLLASPFVGLH